MESIKEKTRFEIQDIIRILPHRYPFILIDQIIEMKPGVYHGYQALEPGSILCYYLTEKYNPEDEIRAKVGHFGEEWDTLNK